jgi:hypothetical protein
MSDKVKMPFGQSKSVTPDAGFDPKLKEVMAEIKEILERHDVYGYVSITSQTHSEFKNIFPTWSPVFFDGDNLRFRAKAKDYPTREAHQKALDTGAALIANTMDAAANCFNIFRKIYEMVSQTHNIEHKPFHGLKVTRDQ